MNKLPLRIILVLLWLPYTAVSQSNWISSKVNGISLWTKEKSRTPHDFAFIEKSNSNWVSFQTFGMLASDSTGLEFNGSEGNWKCSSFKKLINNITIAHDLGYSVFLKPHITVEYKQSGVWVGNLNFDTEQKWKTFENSYKSYIIDLAKIADSLEVEMLSMGTELGSFPQKRTEVWGVMIDEVRELYSGSLIYCANFDVYKQFPFWHKVDYMGIDAYFTVDQASNPSIVKCRESWAPIKEEIKAYSDTTNKLVLFTEYGYMSADYCGLKPFESHSSNVNLVAQANAHRALFYSFWDEPWFVGGFSWVWHFDNDVPENYDNILYTPQNKPAESIISKNYGRFVD